MNLQELTPSENLLLAEELWDSVVSVEQLFPLTEAQEKELDARLASYSIDPEAGNSWENVRKQISNS